MSPDKIMLVMLLVFFGDIFISEYSAIIYFLYLIYIVLTALSVQMLSSNKVLPKKARFTTNISFRRSYHVSLWLLSLPSIVSQAYMFLSFGGLEGYANIVSFRVMEFSGYGPLLATISAFGPINLIYFTLIVSRKERDKFDIIMFTFHLLFFLMFGLASSSRGALLVNFVLMLIVYHYMFKPVSFMRITVIGLSLLAIASILAIARGGYRVEEGQLLTGFDLNEQENTHSSFTTYGLEPLNLVLASDIEKLYFGQTYLTLFTNFIPRSIWPEKPDTGGVILTVQYTLDSYLGLSNLSTGIIPEAVINFGPYFGVVAGFVFYVLLLRYLLNRYFAMSDDMYSPVTVTIIGKYVRYAYLLWYGAAFLVGEFTSIGINLILSMFAIYIVIYLLSSRKDSALMS